MPNLPLKSLLTAPVRAVPQPDFLLTPLRRGAATGAEEAANQLARVLASVPDRHLEQLMRTPARRVVVEAIFLIMPRYLDRTSAAGLDLAIRWNIRAVKPEDPPDVYDLVIAQRRCRVTRGESEARPLATITVEPAELLRLAIGTSNPMQAYFRGRLSLRGDIMQAARLTALFRVPAGTQR